MEDNGTTWAETIMRNRTPGDSPAGALDVSDALVLPTGASTARTMAARFADVVNVKDFGAVCDGVTDDTAAVQAMLTALGTTNSRTIVVSGPCSVASNLTIPALHPVRREGNGAFVGAGIVTFRPWGTVGASAPTVRRHGGTLVQNFGVGSFALCTAANATGAAVAYSDAKSGQQVSWTSATPNQYTGVKSEGTYDLSTSDLFMLDVGFDLTTWTTRTAIQVYACFDTGTGFTNYALWSTQMHGYAKPERVVVPLKKSDAAITGTANWAAVKRFEIRFTAATATIAATAFTGYVYGMWAAAAARSKVIVCFDDGTDSWYANGYPLMRNYGIRGTQYVNGNSVGGAGRMTLAQLKEIQAAGFDVGCHTWNHDLLSKRFASLTRSGTTATGTIADIASHGFVPGSIIHISGSDEGWNGDYTVLTTPTQLTFTFTCSASLETSAVGRVHLTNYASPGTVRNTLQRNRDWLIANGFVRGADHHAYPYGDFDLDVIAVMKELGYKTGRTILPWPYGTSNPSVCSFNGLGNPYEIPMLSIAHPATAATILAAVDQAVSRASSIVLMTHAIVPSPATAYDTGTAVFDAILAGLASRRDAGQIDCVTISEWYDRL